MSVGSTSPSLDICSACGARQHDAGRLGPICLVREDDRDQLGRLMTGGLDRVPCSVCGRALDREYSVVAVSRTPASVDAYVAPAARAHSLHELTREFGVLAPVPPIAHATLAELKEAVNSRLRQRLGIFGELAMATARDEESEFLDDHWRQLTPESFCAASLAASGAVHGFQLMIATSVSDEDDVANDDATQTLRRARQALGRIQAKTWFTLLMAWRRGGEHGPSLYTDLQDYVVDAACLPGAASAVDGAVTSAVAGSDTPLLDCYLMSALRFAIPARDRAPRPDLERRWAFLAVWFDWQRMRAEQPDPYLDALALPPEFLQATISDGIHWGAVRSLAAVIAGQGSSIPAAEVSALEQASTRQGRPGVLEYLTGGSAPEHRVQDILQRVGARHETTGMPLRDAIDGLRPFRSQLVGARMHDELEQLADGLLEIYGTPTERARIEAFLAVALKELRRPQRVIDRIGDRPQPWEAAVEADARAALLTERSNALRILGRKREALAVAEEALAALPPDAAEGDVHVGRLNIGILLRETGAPAEALQQLEPLTRWGPVEERLSALMSVVVTLMVLGRHQEADAAIRRAEALAVGPLVPQAMHVRAVKALVLGAMGQYDEVLAVLDDVLDGSDDPFVQLPVLSSVAPLTGPGDGSLTEEQLERIEEVLLRQWRRAVEQNDATIAAGVLRLRALIHETRQLEDAEACWEVALDQSTDLGLQPEPVELLRLAGYAFHRGDRDRAMALLDQLEPALLHQFGGSRDLGAIATGPGNLDRSVRMLTEAVLVANDDGTADWADVRRVADAGRDALSRSLLALHPESAPARHPTDDLLASLAAPDRSVAVIEWLETQDAYLILLTRVDPDGSTRVELLRSPGKDGAAVLGLAQELPALIKGWRRSRQGDPLDDERWRATTAWFQATVGEHLPDGGHVVVIEHPDFAGLPWHAACGARWTCSYAASWQRLLSRGASRGLRRLGLVRVPKFGDSPTVLQALLASRERTRELAARVGVPLILVEDRDAERAAIERLLGKVDVVMLLCHGYVDPVTDEVALMVAHDGALPLRDSIVAASASGELHRLSWRRLQTLGHAPRVIFSLACSSGVVHSTGLGERLGLLTGLRMAGTRSLVAPRWDVPARDVAPVLDRVLDLWLTGSVDLAQAVQRASLEALHTLPPRYAWALTLEGDWS